MAYVGGRRETNGRSYRYFHRWTGDSEPHAQLLMLHGLGDHGGRFSNLAEWLSERGIDVWSMDLIGHGRSPGRRGSVPSFEALIDEVELCREVAAEQQGGWSELPQFLLGQSMGGNLVINWGLRQAFGAVPTGRWGGNPLAGIIASSPMLRPARPVRPEHVQAAVWLARCFPHLRLRAPVRVELLARDNDVQAGYRQDRWVHCRMSLRLAAGLLQHGARALEQAERLTIPTLLLHGSQDRLSCLSASREFASRAGSALTRLNICYGFRHDLHRDVGWEAVAENILSWLENRLPVALAVAA
jgi:alpha-beta hydrolase superfamily lysophospholipase